MKNYHVVLLLLLIITITIAINGFIKPLQKKESQNQKQVVASRNQHISILTPEPKIAVLGSSTSGTLRTYKSQDGGYALTYPSNWTPSSESQLKSFTGDILVFTIGPVGNKALGFPSFLQIAVDENSQNLSLAAFITKQYGTVDLAPVTIGGYAGEQTTEVQAPVSNTVMLVKPTTKIYQIRFYDGTEPKITKDALQNVLKSFSFQ